MNGYFIPTLTCIFVGVLTIGIQRFQPCGFDSAENTYFLLDDNRLYLRTPMIVPSTTKPVKSSKKSTPRPAKRRRLSTGRFQEAQNETPESQSDPEKIMLESMEWRCVCATLEDYYNLIDSLKKSKDTDEKLFYRHLMNDILPAIQAAEKVYNTNTLNVLSTWLIKIQ